MGEGQVSHVGRRAQLIALAQRRVLFGRRLQHLPHEQALAGLRGAVDRGRHGHVGRTPQVRGQPPQAVHGKLLVRADRIVRLAPRLDVLARPFHQIVGDLPGAICHPLQFPIPIVRKALFVKRHDRDSMNRISQLLSSLHARLTAQ